MKRALLILVVALAWTPAIRGQEPIGSAGPETGYRAGWTFIPSLGFGEVYDDNISLFGVNTAEDINNDVVQSVFPAIEAHYEGKHTTFGAGYTGSYLSYHNFSALNRWGQHGRFDVSRQETRRLKWDARGNVLSVPTTDQVDVGGLPFKRTGATTTDGRAGVTYQLSVRDSFSASGGFQRIDFDEPLTNDNILHGGDIYEGVGAWRHRMSQRLAVGTDYSYRRATVYGTGEPFNIHSVQAGGDYELSEAWALSAEAGIVYLAANADAAAHLGPAVRVFIERHRQFRTFHVGYLQSYIPSFGFGGTVRNREVNVGFYTPLFHSRRFYTRESAIVRDDHPVTTEFNQLPLRSLRMHALIGWAPHPWLRIEGFYARTQQTNFGQFGQLYRNRIGFQIVTSKPMRMQ